MQAERCWHVGRSQPPTELQSLVDSGARVDERIYLGDLLARKRDSPEKGEIVLEPIRGEAISAELENYERDSASLEAHPKTSLQQLDATLRRWIDERASQTLNWMELDGQLEVSSNSPPDVDRIPSHRVIVVKIRS